MKIKPTPTSPKAHITESADELGKLYNDEQFQSIAQPPRSPRLSLLTLIFSLIFGFVAGILGELVFNVYLLGDASPLMRFLQQNTPPAQQTIIHPRTDQQVTDALAAESSSLLSIYPKQETSGTVNDAYAFDAKVGTGVILTNDGWGVTTKEVLASAASLVAITSDRKVMAVKHTLEDPASGLVFFKIDGHNYPVAAINDNDAEWNESLYALTGSGRQTVIEGRDVRVEEKNALLDGALESSDSYNRFFLLNGELPDAYRGAPVVDQRGRALGIVSQNAYHGNAAVLSGRALHSALNGLLRDMIIHRATLGIHYIDIATVAGANPTQRNEGALVTGTKDQPAVIAGSPASTAGVKSGDLIMKVDAEQLSEEVNLSTILQDYSPGAVVTLQMLRDGKEVTARVTLGEQTSQ